jgi:hypothetical protein
MNFRKDTQIPIFFRRVLRYKVNTELELFSSHCVESRVLSLELENSR